MKRSSRTCRTMQQAAGSPAVFGVVLQNLSTGDRLKYVAEQDVFLIHFDGCVLGDTEVAGVGLRLDPGQRVCNVVCHRTDRDFQTG